MPCCPCFTGVVTAELNSGKADAKAHRKGLTHRAEDIAAQLVASHTLAKAYDASLCAAPAESVFTPDSESGGDDLAPVVASPEEAAVAVAAGGTL
jgi:hypothetical protein